MTTNNNFEEDRSDAAVLAELGSRLGAIRLDRNMTQAQLSNAAGVSKRTLERIEAGHSTQITSFIRILRALKIVERLELLVPHSQPSPMELLKRSGRLPRRATGKRGETEQPWQWGNDE